MVTGHVLQRLWKDKLTVTEYQKVVKPNKSTGFEEVIVLEDQPCKLSFSTLQAVNQGDTEAQTVQVVKLFLSNDLKIKPGSKIMVQRKDDLFEFSQSGLPAVFSNHQEIVLVPFEGWA